MKTIVFDVDGVLANFTKGFTTIGNRLFGIPIVENDDQLSWNFKESLTSEQQSVIWNEVKSTLGWWRSLVSLVSYEIFYRINRLTIDNEVYFVTNRFSYRRPPGEQTVSWLMLHGIPNPRVIVSEKKGEICDAIRADFSLEDNWSNALSIHDRAPGCQSFLIERRYNEKDRKVLPEGMTVVKTVTEYLDHITERI